MLLVLSRQHQVKGIDTMLHALTEVRMRSYASPAMGRPGGI